MSIKLYVFEHDQTAAVNEWIADNGELPPVEYFTSGAKAATFWENVCEIWLYKNPWDGNNDPVYLPGSDITVYCSY